MDGRPTAIGRSDNEPTAIGQWSGPISTRLRRSDLEETSIQGLLVELLEDFARETAAWLLGSRSAPPKISQPQAMWTDRRNSFLEEAEKRATATRFLREAQARTPDPVAKGGGANGVRDTVDKKARWERLEDKQADKKSGGGAAEVVSSIARRRTGERIKDSKGLQPCWRYFNHGCNLQECKFSHDGEFWNKI